MTTQAKSRTSDPDDRSSRGRRREGASFPVGPSRARLPTDYTAAFAEIKERIRKERLRVVLAANAALVLLYWDIGRAILDRQGREGWGARVIDRLSDDLREAFPDMRGLSPRNLRYMRAFAAAWPDRRIVQEVLAQITWYHCVALLDKVKDPETCLWYARKAREEGWSRNVLVMQIEAKLHERTGKAITNFPATLPPEDSDLATQVFKDPYLFDFLGATASRTEREIEQHQTCLQHLLRRCEHLLEDYPRCGWAAQVQDTLQAGLALRDRRNAGGLSDHGLATARGRLLAQISRLSDNPPPLDDAECFAAHLATEFSALFTFLWDPSVDATNWRAEQAIRPAVVIRKVCGGNRTRKGADTQQVLASVVRTARQRKLDLPALFATMLRAPEPIVPDVFGLPPPAASSAAPERAH